MVERAIQSTKITLQKYREDDNCPYLPMLHCTFTSELLMKRKLWTLIPLLNVNINTKFKKPALSQFRDLQPLNTSNLVCYFENNNWIWTGIILNNNDMPRCYTLWNNNDNVMWRNSCHLIKMNSNFFNIENDNGQWYRNWTKNKT